MTTTPDMPLVERVDAALGQMARRIEHMTGLRDSDADTLRDRTDGRPTPVDDDLNNKPVNPIRHWRWE